MAFTATGDLYDAKAHIYARSHARWLRFAGGEAQCAFEGAVTALSRPGMRMVDVACGTGTVVRRILRQMDGQVDLVLLDASRRMLDQCRDIAAKRQFGCMTRLPFASDSFDLLTCAWGIEVLAAPEPALSEFIRVTRPGGHAVLVFCADRPAQSFMGQALRRNVAVSGRGRFLDPDMLASAAKAAGAGAIHKLYCSGPAAAMIIHV